MFDEWGGTKRELSIYSILTIIVLISISGGCAGFEGQESSSKFPTKLCNDAGLILKDENTEKVKPATGRIFNNRGCSI